MDYDAGMSAESHVLANYEAARHALAEATPDKRLATLV
jgi:hypothetical protein